MVNKLVNQPNSIARHATRLLVLLLTLSLTVAAAGSTGPIRVAVLPFSTPRNMPDLEQYGEGMMDSLIVGLHNVPQLILVDRGRIERILREQALQQSGLVDPKTTVKVGKLLAAEVLVGGSIAAAGKQIRIVANFTEVQTGAIRESQKVTGPLADIFDLQDQLAGQFIKSQKITVSVVQRERIERVLKSTSDLGAYGLYLKGRKAYLLFTIKGFVEAVAWYRKALAADSRYAIAYAALAETYKYLGLLKFSRGEDSSEEDRLALENSKQALALNPDLAPALRAYAATSRRSGQRDWLVKLKRAAELAPNDADTWFEMYMGWLRDGHESDPEQEYLARALALNPDLVPALLMQGNAYADRLRWDKATQIFRQMLHASPDSSFAHTSLGIALHMDGHAQEAMAEFRAAVKADPDDSFALGNLGTALAEAGRNDEAIVELRASLQRYPYNLKAQHLLHRLLKAKGLQDEAAVRLRLADKLREARDGNTGIVGLEPAFEAGQLVVKRVVAGAPAAGAGLQAGDQILKIDGLDPRGLSKEEVIMLIRGPAGAVVTLTIRRPGDAAVRDIPIVRRAITP